MEQKQSVAFLTDVVVTEQQNVMKQKIQISTLRHNIKILAHQLPPREIINQVLVNLGLNYSLVTYGLNLDKEKNLSLSDLKRIYYQLKMIERETYRLKNCNNFQVARAGKQIKLSASTRSASNLIDKQKNSMKCSRSNINLENYHQNDKLKTEILKELSYRKFVNGLKKENYSEKQKLFLLSKAKKAKQMNKRSEKIYQRNNQMQKQSYEQIFNKLKFVKHQDYSIWGQKTGRNALTAVTKFRVHSITQTNQFNQSRKKYSKDHIISERNVKFEDITTMRFLTHDQKKPASLRKYSPCNQDDELTLQTSEIRHRNVLRRKNLYDQEKLSKAIERVVKKNITIQSLHKKQQTEKQQDLKGSKGKIGQSDILKITNSFVQQTSTDEKGNKLKKKIEEKIMKKWQIIQSKSQKLKEAFLKSRERFLCRKNEMDKQNQDKINNKIEEQISFREVNQQKIRSKQLRIQKVIRKTRQKMQQKQVLLEQISNLKRLSDSSLQKKLNDCQKKTKLGIKEL